MKKFYNLGMYSNTFIHVYMHLVAGQNQIPLWVQNFEVKRNSKSLCLLIAILKTMSLMY